MERETLGGQVARVAEAIGVPLLGWQRHVADTALEVDASGRFVYRTVVLTTPRQCGKSWLIFMVMLAAMLRAPDSLVLYACQSRVVARGRLFDTWYPKLARSPLGRRFSPSRMTGAECMRGPASSRLALLSSADESAHGETSRLAVLDEAWALTGATEGAAQPTMATVEDAQLWICSTVGDARSVYLRDRCDAGRTAVETGLNDGTCYFEWSAPEGADAGDPEVWRRANPGVGTLISERTVRADFGSMRPSEFRRAFLNMWPSAEDDGWQVIDRETWERARWEPPAW